MADFYLVPRGTVYVIISKYSIRLRVQYSYLYYFHPDTVIITPQFIMLLWWNNFSLLLILS